MSSTITRLGTDFLGIPKLEVIGPNWVIKKTGSSGRLMLEASQNISTQPHSQPWIHSSPFVTDGVPLVMTAPQIVLDSEWKKEMKIWQQGEVIVKQQIAGTIPDSLFMKMQDDCQRNLDEARQRILAERTVYPTKNSRPL
ncbi:hypothetical protein C8R44DRAFT_746424 [Mycena epipterygia]|nr:hypothetical protein C8R44DRAFT_746424 [Mycena epipterygia]